jgi:hypothetical protein
MMTFPVYGKYIYIMFQSTNQPKICCLNDVKLLTTGEYVKLLRLGTQEPSSEAAIFEQQQLPDGALLPLELQTSQPEMVRDDHHHQHKPGCRWKNGKLRLR